MRPLCRILHVAGARPNFMKVAPLITELRKHDWCTQQLLHTGQHYDNNMSGVFFDDLGIPRPDFHLGVGSGSHATQTAAIMVGFERLLQEHLVDLVVVVGDVNSTVGCALVTSKLGVPLAHVEAGLRSFDRGMPEEINRVVTDQLSDLLFVTERAAFDNLQREGVDLRRAHFVGNLMIDTLMRQRCRASQLEAYRRFGLDKRGYALLTLHRPSNVDDTAVLRRIMNAVRIVADEMPVVFPVHPRTRQRLVEAFPDGSGLGSGVKVVEPLGYLEFLSLVESSAAVLTDSGGIQEETTILGVPCLTLRENTERPITIEQGTNRVVGTETDAILSAWRAIRHTAVEGRVPEYWDGKAAARVADVLRDWFFMRSKGKSK